MPRGWIGDLPRGERRRTLALWLAKCEGNLLRTAHTLGIHRSHMYRLVESLRLWPVVNAARAERLTRERAQRHVRR